MKNVIRMGLLLLLPAISFGQNTFYKTVTHRQADSIRNELKTVRDDTLRMIWSRDLSNYYSELNFDSSLYYGEQVLQIARKHNFKLWEANGIYAMALSFSRFENYPKALESYKLAMKIAEDEHSENAIPHIEYFTSDANPHHARIIVLANIIQDFGTLYYLTGNKEKEISSKLEAIRMAESINDKITISIAYENLSVIYFDRNKIDSADMMNQRAALYADAGGFEYYKGFNLMGKGYLSLSKLKYDSAEYYLKKGVQKGFEQNTYTAVAGSYMGLARLFKIRNQVDSSVFYTKEALLVIGGNISQGSLAGIYRMLAFYYNDEQKQPDSAIKYLYRSIELSDSANNAGKENLRKYQAMGFDEQMRLQELEKEKIATENRTRSYALVTGIGILFAIGLILYRNNRQKQKANKILESTLGNLKSTQSQLVQSEKMASLGELTAGIAHEIQNPLNFVNNFSEVNTELIEEMKEEIDKGNLNDAKAIANDIKDNEQKINYHGKRADAIVKGMLQHSRSSTGVKEPTNINELADEYFRLSYHGLRAKDKNFNAILQTDFDESIGEINIIPQDIGRVLLNLYNNAFYAVADKKKLVEDGYEPIVSVSTKTMDGRVFISVMDNGNGIPQKIVDKIFQPFFTTKPTGQGTGLGLSLSYDIIKAHGGEIKVESREGEGSNFIIQIPVV